MPFGQHQDTELWSGIINKLISSALVSFAFKFDTAVLSKPNLDFPSFSSGY